MSKVKQRWRTLKRATFLSGEQKTLMAANHLCLKRNEQTKLVEA